LNSIAAKEAEQTPTQVWQMARSSDKANGHTQESEKSAILVRGLEPPTT
jgi:hypothetical protein